MIELTTVALITVLAVISPGADFAMITRNSLVHGRRAGLIASLGIAAGVQLHVFYTMLGIGIVLKESALLFSIVKVVGVMYLVYLGYTTFTARPVSTAPTPWAKQYSAWGVFRMGFFTNALNPKTTLFVVSVYTQVVSPHTPLVVQFGDGAFMSLAHWVWFSLVAMFFSNPAFRTKVLQHQTTVNRSIGIVLACLGFSLAVSPQ
jgi:threonine/homoserine/homoserine lactone efflux protein